MHRVSAFVLLVGIKVQEVGRDGNAYKWVVRIVGRLRDEQYLPRLVILEVRIADLGVLDLYAPFVFEYVRGSCGVLLAAPLA